MENCLQVTVAQFLRATKSSLFACVKSSPTFEVATLPANGIAKHHGPVGDPSSLSFKQQNWLY